jgi:hypothetical protein
MSAHVLQAVTLLASLVIFFRVEPAVNLMGRACRLPVRVAFWTLSVGSAWLVLSITQGYRPSLPVTLTICGIAVLLVTERRVRGLLRAPEHVLRDRRARP